MYHRYHSLWVSLCPWNKTLAIGDLMNIFSVIWQFSWPSFCYDIMPVRKEEGKSYWKIPLCDDDATREK